MCRFVDVKMCKCGSINILRRVDYKSIINNQFSMIPLKSINSSWEIDNTNKINYKLSIIPDTFKINILSGVIDNTNKINYKLSIINNQLNYG